MYSPTVRRGLYPKSPRSSWTVPGLLLHEFQVGPFPKLLAEWFMTFNKY